VLYLSGVEAMTLYFMLCLQRGYDRTLFDLIKCRSYDVAVFIFILSRNYDPAYRVFWQSYFMSLIATQ
jgi:hypothetical protein